MAIEQKCTIMGMGTGPEKPTQPDKSIPVKVVRHANTIIRNTTDRAIPSHGTAQEEQNLTAHRRKALRDVLRKGFKVEAENDTIQDVLDTLGPVLGTEEE